MAITYRVLSQSNPSANTSTAVYTCSATGAVISTFAVCNRGAATTFRIAIQPGGAVLSSNHYIVYDSYLATNETVFLTVGATVANTDVISVEAGTALVNFTLFGSEIT